VVEVLALLGLAHQAGGDTTTAVATLDEALRLAESEGFVRVFLDEGAPMTALLMEATRHGSATALAGRVLAAAPTPPRPTVRPAPTGLVEDLSNRELEVLRLLRSDLSGPDIARELVVSLNTVRTHTKSIYLKLGVNSRRAAVRRAAELGL
jgi:LuxR family maltose regulon positive regulatory protein